MKKLRLVAGTAWAILCLVLVLVLFPGLSSFSGSLARLPFMKLNPNYSGGEVANLIACGDDTLEIRKPVFDGLIGERKTGFVQVGWRGRIPEEIQDTIDFNSDSNPDFYVSINTRTAQTDIVPLDRKTGKVLVSTPTSYGWAVRVEVRK
jgi:hypothetical protein